MSSAGLAMRRERGTLSTYRVTPSAREEQISHREYFFRKRSKCRLSDAKGVNMNNFFSTICGFAQSNDFYSIVTFLCEKERTGEIVLYAGTYSLEAALEHFNSYDNNASFYIYTTQDKSGYCVYINRMGCGIREDNKIFKFSHRYLYNKNHLTNCFFGENITRARD